MAREARRERERGQREEREPSEFIDKLVHINRVAKVGKLIAERAIEKGVKDVVFDRGGYIYHGRIKALADAAREAGLQF